MAIFPAVPMGYEFAYLGIPTCAAQRICELTADNESGEQV